jgi:polyisoprenoid-binding protein YceI
VKAAGDNKLEVAGDLTLHGATKPITVTLTRTGTKDTQMGKRTGLEGTFTVKRSDFGMNKMLDAVGDEVTLTVSVEAVKQ